MNNSLTEIFNTSVMKKTIFVTAALLLVGLIGYGTVGAQSNNGATVSGTGYGGNQGFTKTVDNKNNTINIVKPPNDKTGNNGATVTKTQKP